MHGVGVPVSDSPSRLHGHHSLDRVAEMVTTAASVTNRTSLGMNRMIGTEAGLSVQTEGTMVRLLNQRSADSLPNFSFSCPPFISIDQLDKAPLISEAYIYLLRAQFLDSLFDGPRGILSQLAFHKTICVFNRTHAYTGPSRPYDAPQDRGSPRYELCARC